MSDRPSRIRALLEAALRPDHLDVIDESGNHSVPRGAQSHMRVVIVAPAFAGLMRVARHRLVNDALADELRNGLHALAIEAISPAEWDERRSPRLTSPECAGGSRHDARATQQQQQQQQQQNPSDRS
jgi:BolA protein